MLTGNRLLDRLPAVFAERLLPALEIFDAPVGQEVFRQGAPLSHVYFPTSGIFSLVVHMTDGRVAEAATIGCEGMVGVHAALDLAASPATAIVQAPARALRMPLRAFLDALRPAGGELDRLLRRYVAYSLRYANQTVACNLLHPLMPRMCRWLLMAHDRAVADEFRLTHEFLAEMLGVRRQTVTEAAGSLQKQGLLEYRRGVIHVLDREGLEAASCECWAVLRDLYDEIVR